MKYDFPTNGLEYYAHAYFKGKTDQRNKTHWPKHIFYLI